ncbi:MAG: chemotaxis protein CheW, partial [candidate division Zixibacteria bacterium]
MRTEQGKPDNVGEIMDNEITDLQEDKFLTFPLAEEEYGIDIRHVTEIVGIQNITGLPDAPLYVR